MKKQELKARERAETAETPLHVTTRMATATGTGGSSIHANLTKVGVSVHGIAPRDELKIDIYPDGIWIENLDNEQE